MKISLNRKQKAILVIGVAIFLILSFNHFTSKTDELKTKCEAFVRSNEIGCYVSDQKIESTDLGRELTELAKSAGYDSAKEACGCVTYNITDL